MAISQPSPPAPLPAPLDPAWPAAVRRAVAYVELHLREPIRVEELAAAACMSRFHFARVFRASTGSSPMEYLRQRRIVQAQWLLRERGRKVCQVASELCFFDQSHFVRSFRRVTGCTPACFARAAQAQA